MIGPLNILSASSSANEVNVKAAGLMSMPALSSMASCDRHQKGWKGAYGDPRHFPQRHRLLDRKVLPAPAVIAICIIWSAAISRPGTIPARNRYPIDASETSA
jgi:hypothetical protein